MSKSRPNTIGTIINHPNHPNGWIVSAIDPMSSDNYRGPSAEVYADDNWLRIITDKYEGNVILNIEALPQLIKALKLIKRAHK